MRERERDRMKEKEKDREEMHVGHHVEKGHIKSPAGKWGRRIMEFSGL